MSNASNSLFKVLFIFPSWYLYAIGHLTILSFGRDVPPFSAPLPRCTTLTKDTHRSTLTDVSTGLSPSLERASKRHQVYSITVHFYKRHNSVIIYWFPKMSLSNFIRHYSMSHIHFLFLHLLICLNSVGTRLWFHASRNSMYGISAPHRRIVKSVKPDASMSSLSYTSKCLNLLYFDF